MGRSVFRIFAESVKKASVGSGQLFGYYPYSHVGVVRVGGREVPNDRKKKGQFFGFGRLLVQLIFSVRKKLPKTRPKNCFRYSIYKTLYSVYEYSSTTVYTVHLNSSMISFVKVLPTELQYAIDVKNMTIHNLRQRFSENSESTAKHLC